MEQHNLDIIHKYNLYKTRTTNIIKGEFAVNAKIK